jgi:pimeloyl-ACP methyl ester carboxylesterase
MVKHTPELKASSRLVPVARALLLLTCGLAVIGLTPPGKAAAGSASGSNAIVDLPVAFSVENTNSSGAPCPSDGAQYTVRGDLVGPRWALYDSPRRAITIYLHGINVGGFMWRLPGFEELDHAASLARRGHVSLVVDQMGYDSSDHSHGWLNCLGSQADMTRQLVDRLRAGDYTAAGGEPVSFQTVVLAGHDTGATIADIVAYSYPGAIDALVHFNWAEQGFTLKPQIGFAEAAPICASGGQPAEQGPPDRDDPAGGPSGYVQFLTDPQIRVEQFNTEPAVVDRLLRMVNRNPCGQFSQIPAVLQINTQRLPEIEIPVLYGYTDHEFIWTQEGLAQQAEHYRNSRDLTTVVIKNAGHFPNFSRVASTFQSTIAQWLRKRGFVSAGKRGSG